MEAARFDHACVRAPCERKHTVAHFARRMRGPAESNGSSDSEDPLARFRGLTIRETLHALLESDPLGLAARAERALGATALFLDPQRVLHRVAARVAFELELRDGADFERWLEVLTTQSLGELLEEQRSEEARGIPNSQSEDGGYYAEFADATGIDVELVRLVCITVNNLDEPYRRAFRALAVERRSIDACVRDGLGTANQLEQRFREVGYRIALALVERYGDSTFSREDHGN